MRVVDLMREAVERAPADSIPGDVILSLRGGGQAHDFTLYECLQRIAAEGACSAEPDWELYVQHDAPVAGPRVILGAVFAVVSGTAGALVRRARCLLGR